MAFSLLIPEFFSKSRILIVPFYILAGIILGPSLMGIKAGETWNLLAEIGIFFLVFEAGLEIHEYANVSFKRSLKLTVVSGLICFAGETHPVRPYRYCGPTSTLKTFKNRYWP